jgi:hypothetical protein
LLLAVGGAPVSAASPPLTLPQCVQRTVAALPQGPRDVLPRIDGLSLQVLALRSYLRANVEQRWTWSPAQIAAYMKSPERAAALAAIARVEAYFAAHNPGYRVEPNTEIRAIEEQLANFNSNASVARLAARLQPEAEQHCATSSRDFGPWLAAWRVPSDSAAANLAAPGLSPHGQARAFDFRVYQGDKEIAGPQSAQNCAIWQKQHWGERLADAIRNAGPNFIGPLASPKESWHYTYDPKREKAEILDIGELCPKT